MQSIGRTSFNRENNDNNLQNHTRTSTSYRRSVSSISYGENEYSTNINININNNNNLWPVYVGKTRRRYMVSSEVVDHPLFRELVDRSTDGSGGGGDDVSVNCEVVLFEHLLWMLENADPQSQPDSLDELVDFYAY
ncbi:Auxin-responsive protein SAUR76 [Bienertia sinuspersici]